MADNSTLNKYTVWCLVDNKEVESDYRFDPPTVCPENAAHAIDMDPTKIVIVDTIASNRVVVTEDNGTTQGNFAVAGRHVTIDPTIGSVTNIDDAFTYDVGVHSLSFRPNAANVGDKIDVYAIIPAPIGALTADAGIGDTVLNVSSTVFPYINIGFQITIDDGVTSQMLGECKAYDKNAGTITVETALTSAFLAATPSYIYMRIRKAYDLYFSTTNPIDIGVDIVGSSILQMGIIGRIMYTNVTGGNKTFDAHMSYIY